MELIKISSLVEHTDGVWARYALAELDEFLPSRFYDSIKAHNGSAAFSHDQRNLANNFDELLQLSPLRANLLRAFDWTSPSKVLEIGCRAGVITSFLSQQNLSIDAIEPDRALAQLASIRIDSDLSSRIISESFLALDFESNHYDCIILSGLCEFKRYMNEHNEVSFEQAVKAVLMACKALLSKQGKLFLAVENPYAINYLFAAADQSRSYTYINFKPADIEISNQSLNLKEWRNLLANCFEQTNEYYVFPDFYFSKVLLGREYIEANQNAYQHLDSMHAKMNNQTSAMDINESLLYQAANKNGYLGDVANGYLFVMSDESEQSPGKLDFAHFPDFNRRSEFVSVVLKRSRDTEIKRLKVVTSPAISNNNIKQTFDSETYHQGSQLSILWRNTLLADPRGVKFEQYLLAYFAFLKKLGAGVIPGMNVDAIANNIIVDVGGDYHLIDHEWQITTIKIKSDYVFYRAMVHFALRNVSVFHEFKWINGLATLGDYLIYCFKTIGLDLNIGELEPFRVLDCKFLSEVMLESKGYSLSDPFGVDVELHCAVTCISWRYYNEHYHSHQKIVSNTRVSNESQRLTFSLPNPEQKVECFRFFPFQQLQAPGASYFSIESLIARIIVKDSSRIELLSLRNSGEVNEANLHKGIFYGQKDSQHVFMFNNNDTFLEFKLPVYNMDATGTIEIEIDFRLTPSHDYEIARYQYALATREIDTISQIKNEEINSLKEALEEITQDYDGVKNSRVWRLLVAYRDSFKIGGYPRKNFIGKLRHMLKLFKHPK